MGLGLLRIAALGFRVLVEKEEEEEEGWMRRDHFLAAVAAVAVVVVVEEEEEEEERSLEIDREIFMVESNDWKLRCKTLIPG